VDAILGGGEEGAFAVCAEGFGAVRRIAGSA
jgi:hypothetical protein